MKEVKYERCYCDEEDLWNPHNKSDHDKGELLVTGGNTVIEWIYKQLDKGRKAKKK